MVFLNNSMIELVGLIVQLWFTCLIKVLKVEAYEPTQAVLTKTNVRVGGKAYKLEAPSFQTVT